MSLKVLKTTLVKAMRTVKQGNRILLVGSTKAPFDAKVKPFCKLYDRIILIPRPDYGTRYRELQLVQFTIHYSPLESAYCEKWRKTDERFGYFFACEGFRWLHCRNDRQIL